jgi:uncharacterized protein YecE (DUF72 family)
MPYILSRKVYGVAWVLVSGAPRAGVDKHRDRRPIPPMATLRLGTCGWNYDAWVGPFYPSGTRPVDFLSVYARAFNTVEVDSTFYAIPAVKTVRGWASRVGEGFEFALKLPQEITHERRLRSAEEPARQFFDVARELGKKLGPILIQLGPDFGPSELPALAAFLPTLPGDLRFAVEFRHKGWIHEGVIALLAEHHVALALVEGRWIPRRTMTMLAERPTAGFAYVRWMGPNRDLVDYSRIQVDRRKELEAWVAALAVLWPKVGVTYGCASNHFAGHAPATVRMIQEMMGLPVVDPAKLGVQLTLF